MRNLFEKIIGQEKLKKFLTNEINSGNLSYGYIFESDKYMGKSFIARQFATALTSPMYIKEITPPNERKTIQVDDIRDLKVDCYSQTYNGQKKVYIIPNAETMTISAQNAFLKILEEPPQECVFILLTTNRYSLLETIRSRCTLLTLSRYKDTEIKQYLDSLGVQYTNETIQLCNGTLNRYSYLVSEEFKELEGLAFKILLHIKELHDARVFAIYKHIEKQKEHLDDLLNIFLLWYKDLLIYKLLQNEELLVYKDKIAYIMKFSEQYTEEELFKILEQIYLAQNKLKYHCNLEMTINIVLFYMKGILK